jgi:tetratricopeptide (TPR) repeat protein
MADPLQEAVELYNAGQLDSAAALCRGLLQRQPDHPETNHLLGVIFFRQGKTLAARDPLRRATASPRATAEMHNNFGAVLNALGEIDSAAESFKRALILKPDYAWALNNLGVIYRDAKRTEVAIEAFRRAVAVQPGFSEAEVNLRGAYRELVPAWHFAMMHDCKRNDVYETAIGRAVFGKRVLEIGTGAGLLAMMAARAGAASVTTCEAVATIADRARSIVAENALSERIAVIAKRSTDLVMGRDIAGRAEVLITETFSSNLLDEGVLSAIEHAHQHLLAENARIIPAAASAMGFLIGGECLQEMLFVGRVKGFDLSQFNDFAPPHLAVALDGLAYETLSDDVELFRFDFNQRNFPAARVPITMTANKAGVCAGLAQWIKIELDSETRYDNKPSPEGKHAHWSHLVYRFPKRVPVQKGDLVRIVALHDRGQILVDLAD